MFCTNNIVLRYDQYPLDYFKWMFTYLDEAIINYNIIIFLLNFCHLCCYDHPFKAIIGYVVSHPLPPLYSAYSDKDSSNDAEMLAKIIVATLFYKKPLARMYTVAQWLGCGTFVRRSRV